VKVNKQDIVKNVKRVQSILFISKSPQMNLVWGFFIISLIGFLVLSIPWFHKVDVSILEHLFTSISAVSTTGLTTVSVFETYNFFGQLIILVLFQFGGIGYMTLTTYYLLFSAQKISHWHKKIIGAEFDMPKKIRIKDFIKSVVVFTLIMETLGAICLFIAFKLSDMETTKAIWYGIFHSVSAFCTAGLDLFGNSFQEFNGDLFINLTISILCISGSLGFIVVTDLWYRIRKKTNQLSFTSKIVSVGLVFLLFLGTAMAYFFEPSIKSSEHQWLNAFFLAMTSVTTVGFSTIPTGKLSLSIIMIVTYLMYIGASPSGTAGGMKITTFTAIISLIKSRLFGQKKITFFTREIPTKKVFVASSTFILYTSTIFIFTFLLTFTEDFDYKDIIFEVGSALGTVGLTTGITSQFSTIGKILLIALMFIGRLGVLTFGFALLERESAKNKEEDQQSEEEYIAID
jgi:trk system potassium uptake protein TrkH